VTTLVCLLAVACALPVFSASASIPRQAPTHPCREIAIGGKGISRLNAGSWGKHELIPRGATQVILCRYLGSGEGAGRGGRRAVGHLARQRIIHAPRLVSELEQGFRSLTRVTRRGIEPCPFDNGAELDATFRYGGSRRRVVSVGLGGCAIVTDGVHKAYLTNTLRADLKALTNPL
jgi:hypothetical protein